MADGGLRSKLREKLPTIHWQSIESALTGGGIPDANGCIGGVEFWVECKLVEAWKFNHFQSEQVGWHTNRIRHGGRVLVATRRLTSAGPRKGAACDELWIHSGRHSSVLRREGLMGAEPMYRGSGGPSRWDWDRVLHCLVREPL